MTIKTSLLTATMIVSTLLALNAGAHDPKPPAQDMKCHDMKGMDMKGMDMKGHCTGSMEMHKIMMSGMKMPMKMTGNVDKDFASMMSMHHQQAIKMVDVMIKDGSNPQLKALARKMKAAQQAEIKQMAPYTK